MDKIPEGSLRESSMLLDRRFRSNAKFELVMIAELPQDDLKRIYSMAGDGVFGVLRCQQTGQYAVAVDYETSLLVHSLSTVQTLRELQRSPAMRRVEREVQRLVCDEIIQIEKADGSFADGVLAYEDLFGPSNPVRAANHIDPISKAAIDYASAMPALSTVALARRLYLFNSTPRTQAWNTMLGKAGLTARWLGLDSNVGWRKRLNGRYQEYGTTTGTTPWLQWVRHDVDPHASLRHKVYVSPVAKQLPEVLPLVADVCEAMDVPAFKVGITLGGVLRPDKLVVYADNEIALGQVAAELRLAVNGFQAQGVPFTASLDAAGLISWAIDPDMRGRLWAFDEPWSWRMAVTSCLAESITRAKGRVRNELVIDFALQRLRLDLIEPVGWRSLTDWEA